MPPLNRFCMYVSPIPPPRQARSHPQTSCFAQGSSCPGGWPPVGLPNSARPRLGLAALQRVADPLDFPKDCSPYSLCLRCCPVLELLNALRLVGNARPGLWLNARRRRFGSVSFYCLTGQQDLTCACLKKMRSVSKGSNRPAHRSQAGPAAALWPVRSRPSTEGYRSVGVIGGWRLTSWDRF